jgi:similar to stage IV sporulation protein
MRRLLAFLCGYRVYTVDISDAARLLDLLKDLGIASSGMRFSENALFFSVSLAGTKKLQLACTRAGISVCILRERGLPAILKRYKKRLGLVVGTILAALIIALSGTVIWDIRVEGNLRLEDAEVKEALRECGLTVGKVRRRLDTDSIQNRVMINSDDISWISINIIGTVAEVQIRETEIVPSPPEIYDAANVVAAKDGYIERFEDTRGNVIAEVGDLVREGELLVSGLYDLKTGGIRYTSARGRVMARTETEFLVEIPLEYDKKVYTGREFTEKYLIFFEKEIKFFGKCGNLPTSCDTIDKVEYCNLFSAGNLPVGIRTVKYLEYTYERRVRDEKEASELAFAGLSERLSEFSLCAELLKKQTEFAITDASFTLRCKVSAIEDIARIQEIKIS